MLTDAYLGMPLNEALSRMRLAGGAPRVIMTAPPKRKDGLFPLEGREPFVVSVREDGTVIAACFLIRRPRSEE